MPPHSPTNAPSGGFAGDVASVCDAEHPPHTGRVWARCESESNLIHSACQKITFLAYWMCRGDHWSPADLAQQRVFPERFFTDKRARASNARPYKSFLTNWVNQIWFTFSVLPPQSESVLIHFGGPRAYFAQSLRIGLIISTLPFRATSLFRITLLNTLSGGEKRARRTLPIW